MLEWSRVVVGNLENNVYILKDQETYLGALIDPGDEANKILNVIKELEIKKVLYLINTHGHIDHIGANQIILDKTGAEFLIHKEDIPWLKHFQISPPGERFLSDQDRIKVGNSSLTILHTPGHTRGSICIYGDGVLFTGDTLFYDSIGRTDLPGGSYQEIMNSIRTKILPLADNTLILPGHGEMGYLEEIKKMNPFILELTQNYGAFGAH